MNNNESHHELVTLCCALRLCVLLCVFVCREEVYLSLLSLLSRARSVFTLTYKELIAEITSQVTSRKHQGVYLSRLF